MLVVVFDRYDERGEVGVADDLPELPFGFEHAGGGPAQRHLTRGSALHVALGAPDDLDHRLAGFVLSSVRLRLPWTPSRVSVSVSSIPSRSEPAAPGLLRSSSPA